MPALRIIHRSSVLKGRELTVDLPVVRLGRDATCQVLFDEQVDRSVSRQHAELRWEGERLSVVAMPGKVVLLRGVVVTAPTLLSPGDVVELAGPGGPSVEVQWNAPKKVVLGAATASDVDDFSKTATHLPAFVAMPAVAPAPSVPPPAPAPAPPDEIPMAVAIAPPLPSPAPRAMPAVAPAPSPRPAPWAAPAVSPVPTPLEAKPVPVPQPAPVEPARPAPWASSTPVDSAPVEPPPAKHATMILPALDPSSIDPAQQSSTQFLKITDLPPPPPKKQQWVKAVAIGGAVMVLVGAGLGGLLAYQRSEQRRQAVERVERLKEALKNRTQPPDVSDEDWKIYEEEYRIAHNAPPPPVEQPKAKVEDPKAVATPTTPATPAVDPEAKKREAEEKKRKADELAKARAEVRALYAAVKRVEMQRLALGRKAPPPAMVEARKAAMEAYEAGLAKLPPEQLPGGVDAIIRQTARYLGECDGAMPAKFVSEAKAAIEKFKKDPAEKARLVDTIKKADDNRYGPTITAALGDQLVPVELYFVPFELSQFDDRKVGFVTALGYPKGMWQLVPSVAEKFGLKVGAAVANPGFDGGDDRHKYEKEARAAAKAMRALYAGPAAGSALLVLATYANGDDGLLKELKQKAGLSPDDTDPARVNLWKLYEAGALPEDQHKLATDAFAAITIASDPAAFGFSFPPPLKHVALADE